MSNRSAKREKKISKNLKDIVPQYPNSQFKVERDLLSKKISDCHFCLNGLKCNTQETQEMFKGIISTWSESDRASSK